MARTSSLNYLSRYKLLATPRGQLNWTGPIANSSDFYFPLNETCTSALIGRTPKGAYSTRGRSRHILETAFSEPFSEPFFTVNPIADPLLRTLPQNPFQNLLRTLLRTPCCGTTPYGTDFLFPLQPPPLPTPINPPPAVPPQRA